jgi:hypothetical protein
MSALLFPQVTSDLNPAYEPVGTSQQWHETLVVSRGFEAGKEATLHSKCQGQRKTVTCVARQTVTEARTTLTIQH